MPGPRAVCGGRDQARLRFTFATRRVHPKLHFKVPVPVRGEEITNPPPLRLVQRPDEAAQAEEVAVLGRHTQAGCDGLAHAG